MISNNGRALLKAFGWATLITMLMFGVLNGIANGAEQPKCQEWKIQAYFDAADRKDGAAMWSAISPHAQSPWKNGEELQSFLDNTPEQYVEAMQIHALPNSLCNYHVLTKVISITETTKTTQAVLFHIGMDKYGILNVYVERTWEPIVEERTQA